MNLPSLDINDLPALDTVVSVMGSTVDKVSPVASDEILLIVATYFWESSSITASILF